MRQILLAIFLMGSSALHAQDTLQNLLERDIELLRDKAVDTSGATQVTLIKKEIHIEKGTPLMSRKGVPILPELKDVGLQINAVPFLLYIGGIFNKDTTVAPDASFLNTHPMAVAVKYFYKENTAVRMRARVGMATIRDEMFVMLDQQQGTQDPSVVVEDVRKTSTADILLSAGIEKRRGKTRLQGLYGVEGLLHHTSTRTRYNYGNTFSTANPDPGRSDFGTNSPAAGSWITDQKAGNTVGIGARAFLGAEYFFLPKVSIGFEYGWSLMLNSRGDGEAIIESWDSANTTVKYTTQKTGGGKSVVLDTDISSGSLNLSFYF